MRRGGLAVVLLLWAATMAAGPAGYETALLDEINLERSAREIPPVTWNADLARLARRHARDMRKTGEISHASSADGATFAGRLARTDLAVRLAAENVAVGRHVQDIHDGLMKSAGHRANILNPELEEVGIGVAPDDGGKQLYVVQDFATRITRLHDGEAFARLRESLNLAWHGAGAAPPVEDAGVSRATGDRLREMLAADSVDAGTVAIPGPAWVFTYTTTDPTRLPPDVRTRAGRAMRFGLAITFQRTPSAPFGVYWVALALTDPP